VAVQENIDIIRWVIRRNMLQAESQSASRKVENQRPLKIAIAISAHNDYAQSDRLQFIENCFCANVAEMPDLISVLRHLPHALRQAIVCIRKDQHVSSFWGV
jgi:hypothetical protein